MHEPMKNPGETSVEDAKKLSPVDVAALFQVHMNPGAGIGCTMTLKAAGAATLVGQFFCNFGATYSQRFGEQQNAIVAPIDLS